MSLGNRVADDKWLNGLIQSVKARTQDYIVAEGKSGIWTWRKWANGIAECWGKMEFSVSGHTVTLPFSFSEAPICGITMVWQADTSWTPNVFLGAVSNTENHIRLAVSQDAAEDAPYTVMLNVKGKWK